MRMLALSACAFCAIAAVLHLASIAAVVRRMRRFESDETEEETLEGISIVRPVCGLENFTEETLLSGFLLEYPDYEILFCVAQPSDPVIPLVRRLIDLHPHVRARLLIGNECISANPKLNNVVKGWTAASHPWIVMADSNVLMPPTIFIVCLKAGDRIRVSFHRQQSEAHPATSGPSWNARSSIPIKRAGKVLPTASDWALLKARRCCFAARSSSRQAVFARSASKARRMPHSPSSCERVVCACAW